MLFQIGPVAFEGNRGPSLDGVDRKTEASLADKGLIGGLPGDEWTGWSGEVTLSGKVLPYHLGGLDAVEDLHTWCSRGIRVPVMRGDGVFLGWFAIRSVSEKHSQIGFTGAGYEVGFDVALKQQSRPDGASIEAMIGIVSGVVERMIGTAASAAAGALSGLFG